MRRIKTVLLLLPLAISMGLIAVSLSFVRNAEMVLSPEMIQTLAYSLMLLTTFVFIGLSKNLWQVLDYFVGVWDISSSWED